MEVVNILVNKKSGNFTALFIKLIYLKFYSSGNKMAFKYPFVKYFFATF